MLLLLWIVVFFAADSSAGRIVSKFHSLTNFRIYLESAERFGVANSRMSPNCQSNGAVCNIRSYFEHVTMVKFGPERGLNGEIIIPPNGGSPKIVKFPNFDKTNWALIGDGSDMDVFSNEIDKSGFSGQVDNKKIFKGWNKPNTYTNVMAETRDILTEIRAKYVADGKPLSKRWFGIIDSLQILADGRRCDMALRIVAAFETEFKGWEIVKTDPIKRPYVPSYQKIDTDQTISRNRGKLGFEKVEQQIRDFIPKFNSGKSAKSHFQAILSTDQSREHAISIC